jgi:hypothetical protein
VPIYIAHFVVLQQDIWYAKEAPYDIARTEETKRIESHLFEANDASLAYLKVSEMLEGLNDAHCDGKGDRTNFISLGIHDLDEVIVGDRSLEEELQGPYGLEVGHIHWSNSEPEIRLREQLSVFAKSGA